LEKPRFLFLEGSGGASAAPAGASTDDPVVGASAPSTGTSSTAASAARGDRGGGFHLSGRHAPCRSSPPPPTTSSQALVLGRLPAARAAGTPHHTPPGVPTAGASSPSRTPPVPVTAAERHGRPTGPGVLAGLTARRVRSPAAGKKLSRLTPMRYKNPRRKERHTHHRGVGKHHERPEVVGAVRY
jgi:hypothetical protein